MILQLTYATATDLISFTEKLVALQKTRRSRVTQIQKEFNDIVYDIFVIRGVPFTEVVQFLQEFGSSVEMEKPAHALFTNNMKTETEEEKQKERLVRRNAMRRVVSFFNDMMLGYFRSHAQAVEGARAEAENGPRLLTFSEAAAIFSLPERDFRYVVGKARIPVISLGKDASGEPIERISMRSLELFVQILSNASFADANTYIYQHSVLSYPTEDEFNKTRQFVLESVRTSNKAKESVGQTQSEKPDDDHNKPKDANIKSKETKSERSAGYGHTRNNYRNNDGMGGSYHAPQYGGKKGFNKTRRKSPELDDNKSSNTPEEKPWGNKPASPKTPEQKFEAGGNTGDKPEKSLARTQKAAQSDVKSAEIKQIGTESVDAVASESIESTEISSDTAPEMEKQKMDDGQPLPDPTPETENQKPDDHAEENETDGQKPNDEVTDSEQDAKADADKNADFENTQHVPNDLSDLLKFARDAKSSAQ